MTDWTTQAADIIENAVGAVRDKTVEPATFIVRVVVYGLLAVLLLVPAVVLLGIVVFRVVDILAPSHPWLPYGIVSAVTLLAGTWCMRKRTVRR